MTRRPYDEEDRNFLCGCLLTGQGALVHSRKGSNEYLTFRPEGFESILQVESAANRMIEVFSLRQVVHQEQSTRLVSANDPIAQAITRAIQDKLLIPYDTLSNVLPEQVYMLINTVANAHSTRQAFDILHTNRCRSARCTTLFDRTSFPAHPPWSPLEDIRDTVSSVYHLESVLNLVRETDKSNEELQKRTLKRSVVAHAGA